jgi:uncharacterized protein (DUF342 family)
LRAQGVVHGVLVDQVRTIVYEKLYVTNLLVARGQKAEEGQDGRLEFLFEHAPEVLSGKIENDEDWNEINIIHCVTANQPLVRRVPSVPGSDGITVTGKKVEPHAVVDVALPAAPGTKVCEDDPNVLVAAIDGTVRFDPGRVAVDKLMSVRGDVNISVGNIDFHGSVRIGGNVLPGFRVRATGDIHIGGYVEAADVYSGGSVWIARSILGPRPSRIQAEKDIRARIASNSILRAGGDITIQGEVVNCRLRSGRNISVGAQNGVRSRIVGGETFVAQELYAVDLGSSRGAPTIVNVTQEANEAVRREQRLITEVMSSIRAERSLMEERLVKLAQLREFGQLSWSQLTIRLLARLKESVAQIDSHLQHLQGQLEDCQARLAEIPAPRVVVYGTLLPGTTITIGRATRSFNERLRHVQIVLDEEHSTLMTSSL